MGKGMLVEPRQNALIVQIASTTLHSVRVVTRVRLIQIFLKLRRVRGVDLCVEILFFARIKLLVVDIRLIGVRTLL